MKKQVLLLLLAQLLVFGIYAQDKAEDKSLINASAFSGIKLRNVGPAFTSGRISDIAFHPDDNNVWYVAVASGGVWKTQNAGVTWQPLFDNQSVYSTGCITIDPTNPSTIWVGTGENVGGRHIAFGDGVYKSMDGGRTWKNMGLKKSEHISKIIVHPEDPNTVWVAAQGPLWNKGDERGLYKTTDGGQNWKKVLGNAEWTGVTDLLIDPRNPNLLYAATWDRHRTVAAYMGGGPGSGIHRSMDGGETWEALKTGLPSGDMGKIGLAISPQQPDVIYAAIELEQRKGAVYRSADRGSSWEKRSDAVSGATGPHYYQELYACPHNFDRLYLMDVRTQISTDGGKTFTRLNERGKHSDNHAIVFRMDDPDYIMLGSDGGIYETFDGAKNWRFIDNLPITQYYKVAVDDREPFYHIFGGTQDNGSHGGPSRTDADGIRNKHWYKTLGGDGHQSATEPGNPNITYAETQQGGLHRVDQITGEQVFIQPQPGAGEDYERYNWDAPIIVSPHNPARLYFASNRVWKSDNRGDSWTAISGDLTRDEDRTKLEIMGKKQSYNAAWDMYAMSNYNTITSLSESAVKAGLVYAGTDDGIVQVTEDDGSSWRKIEVGSMPGVPKMAFVNDIKADLHNENTVYVALDNHKYGDYKPYLLKSTDKGRSWKAITNGLPETCMVWRVVQDHVKPELMFAGTEFGIYFTVNGGDNWVKLKGGVPTISFRDLAIQKRENDLVGASFGRGFFVLDDYSFLREISEEKLEQDAALYSIRTADWFVPRSLVGSQGASRYEAPNPDFGAVFTYHLKESLMTAKAKRLKAEKELAKEGKDIPFPSWDELEAERNQPKPMVWLTVKDAAGNVVRKIAGSTSKGMHRVNWDLRYPSSWSIDPENNSGRDRGGIMATPGTYTVSLAKEVDGIVTQLAGPREFKVERLYEGALEPRSYDEITAFRKELEDVQKRVSACNVVLGNSLERVGAMQTALTRASIEPGSMNKELYDIKQQLVTLQTEMNGEQSKDIIGEKTRPTISGRMFTAMRGMRSTYGPTPMHEASLAIAKKELNNIENELRTLSADVLPKAEQKLEQAGAPWIVGQTLSKE